jgi:hypothetical protein
MQKEQVQAIAEKYRKLASSTEQYDDEKANNYERFADYIEENDYFEDDYYETEEDLLNDFNETETEIDDAWEMLFPEGDEDDSITDFMTQD